MKRHWLTGLTVILGVFLLFLAFAFGFEDDPATSGQERAFGVVVNAVLGLALLGGFWFLRSGRLPTSVSLGVIVVGLFGGLIWFWMVFPLTVALVVLWFGVVKGGLVRELPTA